MCPLPLNGAGIPREALVSGFGSVETLLIITITVENVSVNPKGLCICERSRPIPCHL